MQAPPPLSKAASYFDENVLDQEVHEQKKKLLYDKSLKAYYDPETGAYFEMKAQLLSTAPKSGSK